MVNGNKRVDIIVPGMGGYEVGKRLKRDWHTVHTNYPCDRLLMQATGKGSGAGSDEFLTKPVNRDELMSG